MKGAIYFLVIATLIFSHVKITCYFHIEKISSFRAKAHLVFHWCLYNKDFYFQRVALTFESVDKILWCDHSNETLLTVPSHGAINLLFSSLLNEILKACLWLTLAVKGLT